MNRTRPRASEGWLAWSASVSLDLLLIAAAAAVVIFVIGRLWLVVLPVIVALFITVLLYPPVGKLRSLGWPPLGATSLVVVLAVSLLSGMVMLVSAPIQDELADVTVTFDAGVEMVADWLAEGPLAISQTQVDRAVERVAEELRASGPRIAGGLAAGAVKTVQVVAQLFLALVLAFFFLKDGPEMVEWTLQRTPERHRTKVEEALSRAWRTLSNYLRGVVVIAVVDALLIAIALLLIGVPLVLPLSLLVFVGGFFPFVGAIAAGTVASLVALVTSGPVDAALVVGSILVIQQVEGDLLQPAVMSRAVPLHPVVVLLAITAGAGLLGVAGAFVAVPLVAIGVTLGSYVRSLRGAGASESEEQPQSEPGSTEEEDSKLRDDRVQPPQNP